MNLTLLKSGEKNAATTRNVQYCRTLMQLAALALLVAGLYTQVVRTHTLWVLGLGLLAGNFFCGWLCPYGTAQELCGKIGSLFLKRKLKMPPALQRYLQFSRYLLMLALLALGAQAIAAAAPINSYRSFMALAGGRVIETMALAIMAVFLVIALFFERPFCNYVCSEGIKFGVASLTRLFTIKRNAATCVNCQRCNQACPMNIQVSAGKSVRNAQCINCFQCIAACPANGTLSYGNVGFPRKDAPPPPQS